MDAKQVMWSNFIISLSTLYLEDSILIIWFSCRNLKEILQKSGVLLWRCNTEEGFTGGDAKEVCLKERWLFCKLILSDTQTSGFCFYNDNACLWLNVCIHIYRDVWFLEMEAYMMVYGAMVRNLVQVHSTSVMVMFSRDLGGKMLCMARFVFFFSKQFIFNLNDHLVDHRIVLLHIWFLNVAWLYISEYVEIISFGHIWFQLLNSQMSIL